MKKRIVTCILSLALLVGALLIPMSASAATVDDVYAVFQTLPMAADFDADVQKLMDIVPVTSEQADILIGILNEAKGILSEEKGSDPANYSKEEVNKVIDLMGKACETVNVEYKIQKSSAVTEKDDMAIEFYYEGNKIYEYDGDVISKTGSDISPAALYTGCALIAASVVALIIVRKKIAA